MDKQIRIRILPDGKVEIDSSVYTDCKEIARLLTKNLGTVESFEEKDEEHSHMRVHIDEVE